MRQQVLIGVERRRRWPDEQKLSVLSEVGVDGASVAEVARRHDITRQHLYQRRREMRRKCEASSAPAAFLPVQLAEGGTADRKTPRLIPHPRWPSSRPAFATAEASALSSVLQISLIMGFENSLIGTPA
jgi:transposase-like protein